MTNLLSNACKLTSSMGPTLVSTSGCFHGSIAPSCIINDPDVEEALKVIVSSAHSMEFATKLDTTNLSMENAQDFFTRMATKRYFQLQIRDISVVSTHLKGMMPNFKFSNLERVAIQLEIEEGSSLAFEETVDLIPVTTCYSEESSYIHPPLFDKKTKQ